jgi:hypothetical protein
MKKNHFIAGLAIFCLFLIGACNTEGDIVLPTVETTSIDDITQQKASATGNVTDDGGDEAVIRGICWGTNENPTIDDNKVDGGTGSGTFTVELTGFAPNFSYHARAFATNSAGTSYGADIEFTTPVK